MVILLFSSWCSSLSFPLSWATSTVLPVLQALAARCERWTVGSGPSPFPNPAPSSPPSCTFSPSLHLTPNSPSVLPVFPAPPVRRCLLPLYPGGESPPAAVTQGFPTPCQTPLWPVSSQCLSPLWPSSSPSKPSLNLCCPPRVCVKPRAGYPDRLKVRFDVRTRSPGFPLSGASDSSLIQLLTSSWIIYHSVFCLRGFYCMPFSLSLHLIWSTSKYNSQEHRNKNAF